MLKFLLVACIAGLVIMAACSIAPLVSTGVLWEVCS